MLRVAVCLGFSFFGFLTSFFRLLFPFAITASFIHRNAACVEVIRG